MKLSIQRQCDGRSREKRCDERLEISMEVPDPVNQETSKMWTNTWEQLAHTCGWRRTGGPGETFIADDLIIDNTQYAIPSTRCWVVCPDCAKAMGLTGTDFDAFPPEGPS